MKGQGEGEGVSRMDSTGGKEGTILPCSGS